MIDVAHLDVGEFQAAISGDADGGRAVQVVPVGYRVGVVGGGGRPGIDPLGFGYPQPLGHVRRTQDQRRRLVDVAVGVHQLRVREGDRSVEFRGRADLLGGFRFPDPGVGIAGGDSAESRPQFGDPADVGLERFAPGVTDGVLEDRVDLDRLRHAAHGVRPGALRQRGSTPARRAFAWVRPHSAPVRMTTSRVPFWISSALVVSTDCTASPPHKVIPVSACGQPKASATARPGSSYGHMPLTTRTASAEVASVGAPASAAASRTASTISSRGSLPVSSAGSASRCESCAMPTSTGSFGIGVAPMREFIGRL